MIPNRTTTNHNEAKHNKKVSRLCLLKNNDREKSEQHLRRENKANKNIVWYITRYQDICIFTVYIYTCMYKQNQSYVSFYYAYWLVSLYIVNLLFPVRSGFHFECTIFTVINFMSISNDIIAFTSVAQNLSFGSDNRLVPSCNKPFVGPVLTKFHDATCAPFY